MPETTWNLKKIKKKSEYVNESIYSHETWWTFNRPYLDSSFSYQDKFWIKKFFHLLELEMIFGMFHSLQNHSSPCEQDNAIWMEWPIQDFLNTGSGHLSHLASGALLGPYCLKDSSPYLISKVHFLGFIKSSIDYIEPELGICR